ncbi:MAG TPA: hypothetical protein ENJ45_05580, partial [Phaeodactylibacter sp.]|nr:hypothetical protein [Phaeodactylibacter sp.]
MHKLRLTIYFVLISLWVQAQDISFKGFAHHQTDHAVLQEQFKSFHIFQIQTDPISRYLQTKNSNIRLELELGNQFSWDLLLAPNPILSPDYYSPQKQNDSQPERQKAFNGYLQNVGGGEVALTVDKNFLYGYIEQNEETYFIEPLYYLLEGAATDLFIVYAQSDVIDNTHRTCGADELAYNKHRLSHQYKEQLLQEDEDPEKTILACYDLELAIASDFSMYQKYGSSIPNVENHNIGVMNNVQTNYDDEFTHNVNFVIVTQFVSDCSTCDPWTSSTSAGALLSSFRSWGNGGGFGAVTYDLAQLWTNRNFDGSTVGIAYLGVLCGNSRYHCLQDFSATAWALRV